MKIRITESQYNILSEQWTENSFTKESLDFIRDIASNFNDITDFRKNVVEFMNKNYPESKSKNLYPKYLQAVKFGLLEPIFDRGTEGYSEEEIADKAKDFYFIEDFRLAYPNHWNNAYRNHTLDKLFPFEKERRDKQKQDRINLAIEISKKYDSRTQMAQDKEDSKHHMVLQRAKLLDSVFPNKFNESFGERQIKIILEQMGVDFSHDKPHGNCKGEEIQRKTKSGTFYPYCFPYRFDFFIPYNNKNKKIIKNLPKGGIIIEFDGEQHFIVKKRYGGDEGLQKYINRDIIKNNYCIKNKIKLIRIPYTTKTPQTINNEIIYGLKSKDMFITTGNYPQLGWNQK